ncbi:uncharacterized protein [Watersipora subatra]|uniref:uncharacterized protein n=1 Tax=Watersipora subatra TaxID=2589382 RepID=UPI00355C892C
MRKTYGKSHGFEGIVSVGQRRRQDVFSDSISSSSSNSSMETRIQKAEARRHLTGKTALRDVGNVAHPDADSKPKRNKPIKKKDRSAQENIPNFDSFDDYDLLVQKVTPIKTHVSLSIPTSEDNWDNYPSQQILTELNCCQKQSQHIANLSPAVRSRDLAANVGDRCKPLHICLERLPSYRENCSENELTRSSRSGSHYDGSYVSSLPVSMQTRRAKRLRELMGESNSSMNTSTPEQLCKKISRINSPASRLDLSHIPALDIDDVETEAEELISGMSHVSLHDSLKGLHSPPLSPDAEEAMPVHSSCVDSLVATTNSLSVLSLSDDKSSHLIDHSTGPQQSVSLFTLSYRAGSTLDGISEEEEDPSSLPCQPTTDSSESRIESGLSSNLPEYMTPEKTPTSGVGHSPSRGHKLSIECQEALLLSLKKMKRLSLQELAQKTRRKQILRHCLQSKVYGWLDYRPSSELRKFVKIAEGVYGEVFKFRKDGEVTIIKVVPMDGECTVNDEPQKRFTEMANEIEVTRELSRLGYNFINTKRVVCVQGQYPDILLEKWDNYPNSENDRPDYFLPDQHYAVFEFGDGGEALESYEFASPAEALSCLLQVGWSLAVAEDACEFEHRDLHWGNVLIAQDSTPSITYKFHSTGQQFAYKVDTSGIRVNIIDFTLSRLRKDNETIHFDLADDETLFQGVGDYQFDVYRQMKDVTGNEWKNFHSITNVLWMRYLLDKLIKSKSFPSTRGQTPTASQLKRTLINLYTRCAGYSSTVQMVLSDEFFQEYSLEERL